jgi:hypothetical protein
MNGNGIRSGVSVIAVPEGSFGVACAAVGTWRTAVVVLTVALLVV